MLKRVGRNEIDAAYCELAEDPAPDPNRLPEHAGPDAGLALGSPLSADDLADMIEEVDGAARAPSAPTSVRHSTV